MRPLRVFLANAVLSIPLLLGSLPVVSPTVALCPSYPLTAWLAPQKWAEPSFRWALAPLVAGIVGSLLYRTLRAPGGSRPGHRLLKNSLWGIAFGFGYAWVMGAVEEVLSASRIPAMSLGDIPLLLSAVLFSPPWLLAYPRAARCGGVAGLALIVGGTCFGLANGLLVRGSTPDRPPRAGAIRLGERLRRLSPHGRWMCGVGGLSAALLCLLWAADHLRLVFAPIPVVVLAPHSMGSMPSIFPDGSKIVHVREGDVYVMGSDGSNPVRLAGNPAAKRRPSYSPDGRSIVYVSDLSPIEAEGGRLYVMDADGRGSRRLGERNPDLWGVDYPAFSQDGTRIVCTIQRGRSIYITLVQITSESG